MLPPHKPKCFFFRARPSCAIRLPNPARAYFKRLACEASPPLTKFIGDVIKAVIEPLMAFYNTLIGWNRNGFAPPNDATGASPTPVCGIVKTSFEASLLNLVGGGVIPLRPDY